MSAHLHFTRGLRNHASCHALKIDCGFDAGLLEICASVRGGAFMLKIDCGSDAGLPINLQICMRGCICAEDVAVVYLE